MKRREAVTTKEEYHEQMVKRLGEMEVQIEELMAEATRSDYNEFLTDIRVKQETAKAKLAELQESSGEAWQDLRTEVDKAVNGVETALFVVRSD
jgi:hypothetical protein